MENKPNITGRIKQAVWRPDCSGRECRRGLISVGRGRANLGATPPAALKSSGQTSYSGKPESAPKLPPTFINFLPEPFFNLELKSIAYICTQALRYESDFFSLLSGLFGFTFCAI